MVDDPKTGTARDDAQRLVLAAVSAANSSAPPDHQVPTQLDAKLIGPGGALDSLGLVGLLVAIEERIQDECGVALTLADDRAFARERTPFRTLRTLVDYTAERLEEQRGG